MTHPSPMPPASPYPRQPELAGPPVRRVLTPAEREKRGHQDSIRTMTLLISCCKNFSHGMRLYLLTVHVLVDDDASLEVSVGVRGPAPDVHAHTRSLAIGRGRKVGIVHPAAVLGHRHDCVPTQATSTKVVLLEVARRLVEAVRVEEVVDLIAGVEEFAGKNGKGSDRHEDALKVSIARRTPGGQRVASAGCTDERERETRCQRIPHTHVIDTLMYVRGST